MNKTDLMQRPIIRAASILVENGKLCIIKQQVSKTRDWALPGGRLEPGEKLSDCVSREFKEETGIDLQTSELLYVTDRISSTPESHVVHMAFLVERMGNENLPDQWEYNDPDPSTSSDRIREIRMAAINELENFGFSSVFSKLINNNFPGRGSYMGDFFTFYDE